jgi:hypothetical protein
MLRSASPSSRRRHRSRLADGTETLAERNQEKARAVLDRASRRTAVPRRCARSTSGRIRLNGQAFPRLQMTTPTPPFEGGPFDETLLADLKNNRMRLDQKAGGFGFEGDITVTIADGTGNTYDNRAKTITPIPADQAPSSSSRSTSGACRTCCCARRSIGRPRCATSARTTSTAGSRTS